MSRVNAVSYSCFILILPIKCSVYMVRDLLCKYSHAVRALLLKYPPATHEIPAWYSASTCTDIEYLAGTLLVSEGHHKNIHRVNDGKHTSI